LVAVLMTGTLFLAMLACQKSDVVPPEDATISIAASPATILLTNGTQAAPVNILATVYNVIGVPLPGQDVRFTQTSGTLTPMAGTPVRTDGLGNALTVLNGAQTTTTITAKSGKATATLSLQTASCAIQTIQLDPQQLTFTLCTDTFTLTATVTDTGGKACQGIAISFKVSPPANSATDSAVKVGLGGTTDGNGVVTTQVTLDQATCSSKCPGMDCNQANQQITASGGGITSATVTSVFTNVQ
jgi:hypothetical protein